jgi:general secretion pathway protein G
MMLKRHTNRQNDRLGFTLMEILVVVAILVILAGTASVFMFKYLDDAKANRAEADMRTLTSACQKYKLRNDSYPATLQELVQPTDGSTKPYLDGGQEAILDPWGKQYVYDPSGANNGGLKPDISTTTPDGEPIQNWTRAKQH